MGPPCYCRLNCQEKINEEQRKELYEFYWKIHSWEDKKEFIALLVVLSAKKRTRCRKEINSDRRQVTFIYTLPIEDESIRVCRAMFLSTFSISEKLVRHVMLKKRIAMGDSTLNSNKVGKVLIKPKKSEAAKQIVREHIKSFPTHTIPGDMSGKKYLDSRLNIVAMHKMYVQECKDIKIPESDIVRKHYYWKLFKSEFNLNFIKSPLSTKNSLERNSQSSCNKSSL